MTKEEINSLKESIDTLIDENERLRKRIEILEYERQESNDDLDWSYRPKRGTTEPYPWPYAPEVGDWPPGPQVGDVPPGYPYWSIYPPYWPYYPNYRNTVKTSNTDDLCPDPYTVSKTGEKIKR